MAGPGSIVPGIHTNAAFDRTNEIRPEELFDPALSAFAKRKAAVARASAGWVYDLARGETLGESELGIVKRAQNRNAEW
jgi:hypothetical protein